MNRRQTCLSVLERVEVGEGGRAVDLVVGGEARHADGRLDAEHVPAVRVGHGEVLPDGELDAVSRALEQPLARPRRVRRLHDHVRHLVRLDAGKPPERVQTKPYGTKGCRHNRHSDGSLGWPFPARKYKYIFQIKYTEAILSNSTRKLLSFEIAKMLIAV